MPTEALPSIPLRQILEPHVLAGPGNWSRLAKLLDIRRSSVHGWLDDGFVPPRRIEAVAQALALPADVQAELKRRAGVQVLGVA